MTTAQRDIARQQRHAAFEAFASKNRSVIGFVGFGLVAVLALMLQGYEQSTVPRGIDARHYFERLFEPNGENTAYDAAGTAIKRRGLVREGDVQCRVHDGGRNDRGYDYDCVATLRDPNGCTRYYPFYAGSSSIGMIARPVTEADARVILQRFGLLGQPDC